MNQPVTDRASAVATVLAAIEFVAPDVDAATLPTDLDMRIEAELDSMDFMAVLTAIRERTGVEVPDAARSPAGGYRLMDSPELIPVIFIVSYSIYHFRTIWRVHKRRDTPTAGGLGDTWRKYWRRPEVTRSALRCATRSLGVFLGIEIAEDETPRIEEAGNPEETDHY